MSQGDRFPDSLKTKSEEALRAVFGDCHEIVIKITNFEKVP